MNNKLILILSAAALFTVSCKSQFELLLSSGDPHAKYVAAFQFFQEGKYNKSAQLFESLSMITSGTERDDTVQFYWGLSNYKYKDYYTAETNFTTFIEHFPVSPFTSQAEFLRLDCLYRSTHRYELDQTPTYKAISAISEYMINHPDSENIKACNSMLEDLSWRLDKKAYENAKLYYRMDDFKAARVALRNVLKDNSDNRFREEILYYTAMSSYKYASNSVEYKKKERFMQFSEDYLNFIGEYPDSKYAKELKDLYAKVKEKY